MSAQRTEGIRCRKLFFRQSSRFFFSVLSLEDWLLFRDTGTRAKTDLLRKRNHHH